MSNIKEISFQNGNRAKLVTTTADAPADAIPSSLNIEKPKALILILGGADGLDESLKPRLLALFSRSIACAAIETGAVIMDGGTKAGVMELMGQAVADQGRKSILLGVAPSGKVTYPEGPEEGSIEGGASLDPDHSHFVLVDSKEWGGETEMMFKLAKSLSDKIPVVAILANGGDISRKEVLSSVRQGWPLIVIEGTGGLADDIAHNFRERAKKIPISENKMAEIIDEGDIHLFRLDGEVKDFKDVILRQLTINPTLKLAWERFAFYDTNAILQQKSFYKLQELILRLGIAATLIAITMTQLNLYDLVTPDSWIDYIFRTVIIILPITISILVAISAKFKEGNKWVLLRASAEAIKRAIFCYRTHTEINTDNNNSIGSPETRLALKVESASCQLMKTDVNMAGLKPYTGPIPPEMYGAAANDDGFSSLLPEDYITIRLGDQLNYYQLKTNTLEKQLRFWQWSIYLLGGAGTFLAAIRQELWIALTTAAVGASITFLEYRQVEFTLTKYNQTTTDLFNIKTWWTALSKNEKEDPENRNKLVIHTEKVLQSELGGWIQHMENMLTGLKTKQEEGLKKPDKIIGNKHQE